MTSKPSTSTTTPSTTRKITKIELNMKIPVEKNLIVASDVEGYFKRSLKVKEMGSVKGKLGETLSVEADADKITFVIQGKAIPKRQIKYLARRYLNKEKLHNFLRVVANGKDSYTVKFWTREAAGAE
jgi:hypothetical protein